MKKVAVAVLAMALLMMTFAAVPVMAKPKEKVSYVLNVSVVPAGLGTHQSPSWKLPGYLAPPPEGAAVVHFRDDVLIVTTVLTLTINGVEIPKEYLEYKATVDYSLYTVNWVSFDVPMVGKVDETIEIYTSTEHTPANLWATVGGRCVFAYNYFAFITDMNTGTFEGHGTGALEGALAKGVSGNYFAGGVLLYFSREGTITNWPSGITAWPPT